MMVKIKRLSPGMVVGRFFTTICVSTALLAIANFDGMLNLGKTKTTIPAITSASNTKTKKSHQLNFSNTSIEKNSASKDEAPLKLFKESLAQDEIQDQNPFAKLSTFDPVNELIAKGVKGFQRSTLRSSHFHAEVGYDVLHYDVTHTDGTHSSVLVYLETPLESDQSRKEIVLVNVAQSDEQMKSYMYKDGSLSDQTILEASEIQKIIGEQLRTAVAFFSVSR